MQLYSIFDKKSISYGRPFFAKNLAEANRSLHMSMARDDSPEAKFPEDYSLNLVGHFDETTGVIKSDGPVFTIELLAISQAIKKGAQK